MADSNPLDNLDDFFSFDDDDTNDTTAHDQVDDVFTDSDDDDEQGVSDHHDDDNDEATPTDHTLLKENDSVDDLFTFDDDDESDDEENSQRDDDSSVNSMHPDHDEEKKHPHNDENDNETHAESDHDSAEKNESVKQDDDILNDLFDANNDADDDHEEDFIEPIEEDVPDNTEDSFLDDADTNLDDLLAEFSPTDGDDDSDSTTVDTESEPQAPHNPPDDNDTITPATDDGNSGNGNGKKKTPWKGIIAGVAVVAVAGAGAGGYFFSTTKEKPQEKPKPAVYQLINQEQVEWASGVCRIVDDISKHADVPTIFEDKNIDPVKARQQLSTVFRTNAKIILTASQQLQDLPHNTNVRVHELQVAPSVISQMKKVGDAPDDKTVGASNSLSNILDTYAHTLSGYSSQLDGVASYNKTGLIDIMTTVREDFLNTSQSMEKNVQQTLTSTKMFDNEVTMQAVSQLPFCGSRFIGDDDMKKISSVLEDQKVVATHVTRQRCVAFLDTARKVGRDVNPPEDVNDKRDSAPTPKTPAVPAKGKNGKAPQTADRAGKQSPKQSEDTMVDDTFRSDIRTCNNYLKVTTEDKDNPLLQHGIDDQNAERAQPKLPGYAQTVIQDEHNEESSSSTITTPVTQKSVKGSSKSSGASAPKNANLPTILTGVTQKPQGQPRHSSDTPMKTVEPKK